MVPETTSRCTEKNELKEKDLLKKVRVLKSIVSVSLLRHRSRIWREDLDFNI